MMINILYPGVLLARDAASDAVKCVELVELDELLSELDPSGRVTNPVQGRRVESEADNVGDDEDDNPADTRLGRKTHLEGELSHPPGLLSGEASRNTRLQSLMPRVRLSLADSRTSGCSSCTLAPG